MCERSFSCNWNTQALVVIETLKITFSDDPGFLVFISICIMIIIPALSRHINRWSKFCVVGYSGAVIFTNFCHWLFTNQRIYNRSLHSVMLPFFSWNDENGGGVFFLGIACVPHLPDKGKRYCIKFIYIELSKRTARLTFTTVDSLDTELVLSFCLDIWTHVTLKGRKLDANDSRKVSTE